MNRDPDVEAWLVARQHPLDDAMGAARDIILGADARVTESIEWKTPTFHYLGNIASFNPSKKMISIMFHRGAQIPGDHPRVEGEGKLVRVMRFANVSEVLAARPELEAVVQAWCNSRPSGSRRLDDR